MELVFQWLEVRQGGTRDYTTQGIANEGNASKLVSRTVLSDVCQYFLAKSTAHLGDITIG